MVLPPPTVTSAIGALMVAGVIGFGLGRITSSPVAGTIPSAKSEAPPASRSVAKAPTSRPAIPRGSENDDSEVSSSIDPLESAEQAAARIATLPQARQWEAIHKATHPGSRLDAARALALISALPGRRRQAEALGQLFDDWVKQDSAAATAYVLALPAGWARNESLECLLRNLAQIDGPRAIQLLAEVSGSRRQDAGLSVGTSWGTKEPAAAAAWFLEHGTDFDREHTIQHIVMQWAHRDAAAALEWAALQPVSKAQQLLVTNAISDLASSDPAAAANFASRLPPAQAEEAHGRIATQWARNDPAAA